MSIIGIFEICRIMSLDLAEIGMELKYIFQLIGWLMTNHKQLQGGSLMQLILVTVLFKPGKAHQ